MQFDSVHFNSVQLSFHVVIDDDDVVTDEDGKVTKMTMIMIMGSSGHNSIQVSGRVERMMMMMMMMMMKRLAKGRPRRHPLARSILVVLLRGGGGGGTGTIQADFLLA